MILTYTFSSPSIETIRRETAESPIAKRASNIINACAEAWDITPKEMRSRRRTDRIAGARQAAMVMIRGLGLTLTEVGEIFRRDHGTVIYAVNTHSDRMESIEYATRFALAKQLTGGHATN